MAKAKQPVHIVATLADVAAFFGLTEGGVKVHWRPTMPASCGKAGAWDLLRIGQWLVTVYYKNKDEPSGDVGTLTKKAKLAKMVEEAKLARIKRERLDETLINRTRHTETLMTLSGLYAAAIDEAESIAETSAPKGRKVRIKGQFKRIRARLLKSLEKMG